MRRGVRSGMLLVEFLDVVRGLVVLGVGVGLEGSDDVVSRGRGDIAGVDMVLLPCRMQSQGGVNSIYRT